LDATIKGGNITWWDYQWAFARIINSQFGILPSANLVSNIGFGPNATHTLDENAQLAHLKSRSIAFPLIHPNSVIIDDEYDLKLSMRFYPPESKRTFLTRLKFKLKRKIY
jgi:hypothetical protein